ncbi:MULTISPECIES: PadR family transcriptional regulator [unclassified Rhizobium]|jgi:DNA-binding PadR family transcriptional regulator|uniref:PadR family transcriptional regulator n=1 Tax=unclassified Rhizobium TaxID=2613769 RepID=UPI002180D6FE|nr:MULTISPECIES: PadR family transcriptional regulator [unclassified Rhizobium]
MTLIKRSPVALAVLAMLMEEPLHPYRMQRLIKERGKDEVINVTQRASLYQTIHRLEREALIAQQKTVRDDKRPERTVYEITEKGRDVALAWIREMLSTLTREYPEFPAAVSFLALLTPNDVLGLLEHRAKAIESELRRIDGLLREAQAVPRLFLLEMEYLRALHATELSWVNGVIGDLRAGRITWTDEWLRQIAVEFSTHSKLDKD